MYRTGEATMNYADAKIKQAELERAWRDAGNLLRNYPRNSVGLVSDAIRTSPEYQSANHAAAVAREHYRTFNAWFTKTFKTEIRDEHRIYGYGPKP